MQSYIGWWATRIRRKGGRWHLVESEITNRLVMKCGRQMKLETGDGVLIFQLQPSSDHCSVCS